MFWLQKRRPRKPFWVVQMGLPKLLHLSCVPSDLQVQLAFLHFPRRDVTFLAED